jgi:hypothetical protein
LTGEDEACPERLVLNVVEEAEGVRVKNSARVKITYLTTLLLLFVVGYSNLVKNINLNFGETPLYWVYYLMVFW